MFSKLLGLIGIPGIAAAGPGLPWIALGLLVLFIGSNAFSAIKGYSFGAEHVQAQWDAAKVQQISAKLEKEHKAADVVASIGANDNTRKGGITASVKPATEFTNAHILPLHDCVLPAALQRVYDEAGTGDGRYLDADGLDADGRAGAVSCAEASATFIENNARFRRNAQQLLDLQAAWNAVKAILEDKKLLAPPVVTPTALNERDLRLLAANTDEPADEETGVRALTIDGG